MEKSTFREYLESVLIAALLALFIRTFVFQAYKIPTGSMEPNLLVGDHILVNKFIYGAGADSSGLPMLPERTVRRGDVVVFRAPEQPDEDFIKRVVAVGGDRVEVRDGIVYVNDEAADEPFAYHASSYHKDYGPAQVPEGAVFCLGDNRDNSRDSRYWGPVPVELLKGRALFVYWSYDAPERHGFADSFGERLGEVVRLLPGFFTQTRWDRTFMMIH
jgi:signal peptidase I